MADNAGAQAPHHLALLALVALQEAHDASRARYLEYGYTQPGAAQWEPGSYHLAYHRSLDTLTAAYIAFERRFGFVPELG
jgi:hypothetical protein